MNTVDVFWQGEGLTNIKVLSVEPETTISDALSALEHGDEEDLYVFLEDIDGALNQEALIEELMPMAADEAAPSSVRLHISRCRRVKTEVRFNGETAARRFPPGATIERVRRWAARRAFGLSPCDAAEHVLQIQGTNERPDRDVHIGTLTNCADCEVAFDLVPSQRVEG